MFKVFNMFLPAKAV